MITYYCENCNIAVDKSECPVCGKRTKVTSRLFWCKNCNVPIYDEVCPICGNIIHTMGENINSCCGISLPILEAENENKKHIINCKIIENEYYISIEHDMTKEHYISFIAYITNDRCEIVKLYPEQNAEARFLKRGKGIIYAYCNKDGLIKKNT